MSGSVMAVMAVARAQNYRFSGDAGPVAFERQTRNSIITQLKNAADEEGESIYEGRGKFLRLVSQRYSSST